MPTSTCRDFNDQTQKEQIHAVSAGPPETPLEHNDMRPSPLFVRHFWRRECTTGLGLDAHDLQKTEKKNMFASK